LAVYLSDRCMCTTPPPGGVVVSFDQIRPVSARPTAGAGWAPKGRPERQRADYNRLGSALTAAAR
jgi:hypothetical protein